MKVTVINPHGFCAGVQRALDHAYKAKKEHPNQPIYILGNLVHNEKVISDLEKDGFIILDERKKSLSEWIDTLKKGDIIVFSAHGHDPHLDEKAIAKGLIRYDATCPFVRANSTLIKKRIMEGGEVIYIGQAGHAETEGTLKIDESKIFLYEPQKSFDFAQISVKNPLLVSQTTMGTEEMKESVSLLKDHFPEIDVAARVCDATDKRQSAICTAPSDIDLYIVMGSKTSNNTVKLYDLATAKYPKAVVLRCLDVEDLKKIFLKKSKHAALISGASTGLREFEEVKAYLEKV